MSAIYPILLSEIASHKQASLTKDVVKLKGTSPKKNPVFLYTRNSQAGFSEYLSPWKEFFPKAELLVEKKNPFVCEQKATLQRPSNVFKIT